jgi:integrase
MHRWIHVGIGKRSDRSRSPWFIRWPSAAHANGYAYACFPRQSLAERARREKETELNAWTRSPTERTWTQLVVEFVSAVAGDMSPKHRADIDRVLSDFGVLCGPATTRELTPQIFDRYFALRREGLPRRRQPLKSGAHRDLPLRTPRPDSLAKEYAILHSMCEWGRRRGHLPDNPLATVRKPRRSGRTRPPPTDAELVQLLRAIDRTAGLVDKQGWYILLLLAAVTGYDIQTTVLTREIRHVDLGDEDTGHVGLLYGGRDKTDVSSVRGLPPAVTAMLARRIADLPDGSTRLFTWDHFQRKQWIKLAAAAHFKHRPKDLRAAFGTRAAVEKALAEGGRALDHSGSRVFARHYADLRRVELACAQVTRLPELPPLPAYAAPVQPARRRARTAPPARP